MDDRWRAAIVLAGGRSRRMGCDKATLEVAGEPLVVRVVRAVSGACHPVIVVAAPAQRLPPLPAFARLVRDPSSFEGPLAGLLAGLEAIAEGEATRAFVIGVDAVQVTPELVRALAGLGAPDQAVAMRHADRVLPLPAVVPVARARTLARALVADGERRLRALVDGLAPLAVSRERLLEDQALRAVDPQLLGLDDADDPEALARLLGALP